MLGSWGKIHLVERDLLLLCCHHSAVLHVVPWPPLKFCGGVGSASAISGYVWCLDIFEAKSNNISFRAAFVLL